MSKYIKNYINQKRTFEVDSEDEVATLPTHEKNNLGYHSKAIVLSTGNVYYLEEASDTWQLFGGE